MNTAQLNPICAVQSSFYTPARRVITLSRIAPHPDYAYLPGRRRKSPFRLQVMMAPESASSFEPTIQARSQIEA